MKPQARAANQVHQLPTQSAEQIVNLEDRPLTHSFKHSFRDPHGHVVITDRCVFRLVKKECELQVHNFLNSEIFGRLVEDGLLVRTELGSEKDFGEEVAPSGYVYPHDNYLILKHERIPFQSYPYEWPPEMLYAAGHLTLDMMERLLAEGFGLKDASPYNVLFRESRPIFVDFLSVEPRDLCDPTWLPYAQFVRTFIRPLLVDKYFGIGLSQTLRIYREGLTPNDVLRMCSHVQKLLPPFLTLVSLPALLTKISPLNRQKIYEKRRSGSPEEATFILSRQLKGLRRKLRAVKPDANRKSEWTDYVDADHVSERYLSLKQQFIERVMTEERPRMLLDVGCNEGHFSSIAASSNASTVAIDRDPAVCGRVWRKASEDKLHILPLVVDLTRPTPGLGWRNTECRAFLDRACGPFDCVLMLAVLHHVLVSERIPLDEIMQLAFDLTTNLLLIEYIPPDDPMFQLIARGNDHLYESLSSAEFERISEKYFVIERKERLEPSQRWLYKMRRARVA